jgi:hypothetical protein
MRRSLYWVRASKEAMMKPRILRKPPFLRALAAAGAIGLVLSASTALAQANNGGNASNAAGASNPNKGAGGDSAAGASDPNSVSGVVVPGQRRPENPPIPADKKAEYDAEVAKQEAWKRYRKSMPPATASTIDQANDYPGLRSLIPGQEEGH